MAFGFASFPSLHSRTFAFAVSLCSCPKPAQFASHSDSSLSSGVVVVQPFIFDVATVICTLDVDLLVATSQRSPAFWAITMYMRKNRIASAPTQIRSGSETRRGPR
jgi:hypothetical protein